VDVYDPHEQARKKRKMFDGIRRTFWPGRQFSFVTIAKKKSAKARARRCG
jgi:hypothetical protein